MQSFKLGSLHVGTLGFPLKLPQKGALKNKKTPKQPHLVSCQELAHVLSSLANAKALNDQLFECTSKDLA